MWMVDPKLLCNKHLIGEHGEIHKHRHVFVKGQSIDGRINPVVQIEPKSMQKRHDELTKEMENRFGKSYNSPYIQPDISYLPHNYQTIEVDTKQSINDLLDRCECCRERINKNK